VIHVRNDFIESIRSYAERDYPHECCGLLIGRFARDLAKIVTEVYPISNASEPEARQNRFLITADELMVGDRYARGHGLDVVGFYHSHPDHPAVPSAYDLEHAWPVYSYVIVPVHSGIAADPLSWIMESDRSRFASEAILEGGETCLSVS